MTRAVAIAVLLLAGAAGAQLVDGVAAVIDKQVILLSEVEASVDRVARRLERQAGQQVPEEMLRRLRAQALESLIEDRLLLAEAKRRQLEAPPEEVDGAIEFIAIQEGIDVETVYRSVEQQGLGREAYRTQIAEQLLRRQVIDQSVRPRITVTDEEIRRLFAERYGSGAGLRVRARHILVPWPPDGEAEREEAVRVATKLREMALQGAPFADLAQRYSAAPTSRDGGLTVFHSGEVVRELSPFVFEGEIGAISEPIATDHGVNLIQLVERFDPSQVKLEDVRDDLQAELESVKLIPALEEFLRELRKQHYVEVVAPSLR